jgi:uncharacterized membrane protein YadS
MLLRLVLLSPVLLVLVVFLVKQQKNVSKGRRLLKLYLVL